MRRVTTLFVAATLLGGCIDSNDGSQTASDSYAAIEAGSAEAVSYTHLTLPTIYSV